MRSEPPRRRTPRLALAVLACGLAGCATPRVGPPLVAQTALVRDELAFWQSLEGVRRVTADDALHALFLLADGRADHASFAARRAKAIERGWLAADDARAADDAASLGLLAVAVCRFLPVERGVTGLLFPGQPRGCVRDLAFHGLLPRDRPADSPFDGLELIEMAGRIEDWRTAHAGLPGAGS
ncbi:MAG: hypothetical protein FJ293_13365 [Planctomycetes bacterium]|nr:hypothetical protein [Planctomycetota bacterium]